jgi:predicted transposase YbfD/YdcC
MRWITAVSEVIGGEVIAMDGKYLRGSQDKGIGKGAIDMVSAWAVTNRLVLGQIKVDNKSNEITAIPELLRALDVAGCIVTIDAIGCQTDIAEQIVDKEADYVLALKKNQGHLYEDVERLFEDLQQSNYKAYAYDYEKTVDKDHGRLEIRECWTISDAEVLRYLRGSENWKKLNTVSRIRSQRWIGDEKTVEDRYHIASIVGAKHTL